MASKSKYSIKQYSLDRIKELNNKLGSNIYSIKISTDSNKKLDVFRKDEKITSVGAIKKNGVPYLDYPTYMETIGQEYADRRRDLYYKRHSAEPPIKDGEVTTSWWTKYILW
jgi:hypothetical protein